MDIPCKYAYRLSTPLVTLGWAVRNIHFAVNKQFVLDETFVLLVSNGNCSFT